MPIIDFIITVFCLIDDEYKKIPKPIRQRGFKPALSDSEVITMELVGEFLGIDTDKGIWNYFKTHYFYLFPRLKERTIFVRQAANLMLVKEKIRQSFVRQLDKDTIHIVDGFPISICSLGRAHQSKRLKEHASFGYCAAKDSHYFGLSGHLIINSEGLITSLTATAANVDEREVVPELAENLKGLLLGDKGYIKRELSSQLKSHNLSLVTLWRKNQIQSKWMPTWIKKSLIKTRKVIETVISQLTERFNIEKVRVKDIWHFTSRFLRKALSHTTALFICKLLKLPPIQFEKLIN